MFAHTHRRSLSLLLPWTSLQGASILLTLSTPSTLKNPCMCHSREHSQKPRVVLFSKISPVKVSVCLYYEKPMEMNTLSINIVYSSESVGVCFALNWRKEEIKLFDQWDFTSIMFTSLSTLFQSSVAIQCHFCTCWQCKFSKPLLMYLHFNFKVSHYRDQ